MEDRINIILILSKLNHSTQEASEGTIQTIKCVVLANTYPIHPLLIKNATQKLTPSTHGAFKNAYFTCLRVISFAFTLVSCDLEFPLLREFLKELFLKSHVQSERHILKTPKRILVTCCNNKSVSHFAGNILSFKCYQLLQVHSLL